MDEPTCATLPGHGCSPGQTRPAPDGCNSIVCEEGWWGGTTLKFCGAGPLNLDGGRVGDAAVSRSFGKGLYRGFFNFGLRSYAGTGDDSCAPANDPKNRHLGLGHRDAHVVLADVEP